MNTLPIDITIDRQRTIVDYMFSFRNRVQNMNQQRLLATIAAILTTIYETSPNDPIPASPVYMALGMNIELYTQLTDIMVKAKLIVKTSETLALTDVGRDKAIALTLSSMIGH